MTGSGVVTRSADGRLLRSNLWWFGTCGWAQRERSLLPGSKEGRMFHPAVCQIMAAVFRGMVFRENR